MTDIFISYAREDSQLAHDLADYLKANGFQVWWDREILSSDDFYEAILNALTFAKAAVVIWTGHSVQSHFVRDEARFALVHKKLVAVKSPDLPVINIPFGFQSQHTDDVMERDRIIAAVVKLGAKPAGESAEAIKPQPAPQLDKRSQIEDLSMSRWSAFWRGLTLSVPDFVPRSRSVMWASGAIVASISISLPAVVALFALISLLRSRHVGTDLENFVAVIALSIPWLLNLKILRRLFQQRAFKSAWILALFWSLLSILYGAAVVYA